MKEILEITTFEFPYTDLHFPGMNTGEKILFVTRESALMVKLRYIFLGIALLFLEGLGFLLISLGGSFFPLIGVLRIPLFIFVGALFLGGLWWIGETHRKSVFIITTRRLTKIIYTTPFTWYQFSLGLDEIEDTGSYSSSYVEEALGLGYFVARSGAGAIKNFKIVNVTFSQDLHNYVNKLLYAFKHNPEQVVNFRPFIPHLKGEARKEFLVRYPEYKTEF